MSKEYSNVRLLQLNNYVKPEIKESHGDDWVLNGKNNSYFKYVIDRYNGSSTNSAIINSFVERIYGRGLTALNAQRKPEEYVRLLEMFPKKELKKVIADFKLQGNAAIEVIYSKVGKEVVKCYHIPVETLGADKVNKDGDIEGYWYSQDWKNPYQNKPEFIPAFGFGKGAKKEILYIKPYKAGQYYFATPDYQAALQYAELEEEIANFSINHIKNGLSLGQIINFNNGKPDPEVQDEIERNVNASIKGSSGKRFILSFNESKETATEIQQIAKDDASAEWHFWVNEARQQIITGHRVVSPMLFGIKDATGLGNNANEMETANALMEQTVIRPYQETILDAIDEILQVNNIHLDLAFKPLQEMKQEVKEEVKEEVKAELAADEKKKLIQAIDNVASEFVDLGQDIDSEEYDLIDEIEVDYEEEKNLALRHTPHHKEKTATGTARGNARSDQDGEDFIVRYKYAGNPSPQREFCKKMMRADKVYRKEDIMAMENKIVNQGWGAHGSDTYSIWLYKGGGNCKHKWNRVIYLKKGASVDVNSPLAQIISTSEARRRGMKIATNDSKVSIAPFYQDNRGFLPGNPQGN
jgi:hypothetical protein